MRKRSALCLVSLLLASTAHADYFFSPSSSGSGGVTIGDVVGGANPTSVLFISPGGGHTLSQSSLFQFDSSIPQFSLGAPEKISILGNSQAAGLTLQDTTVSTSGSRSHAAPYLYFLGTHWNGTSSVINGFRQGFAGAAMNNVYPAFKLDYTIDGAAYTNLLSVTTSLASNNAVMNASMQVGQGIGFGLQVQGGAQITQDFYAGAGGAFTGNVRFQGSVSGETILTAQDAAGSWTMKLPNSGGSANQVLTTDGTGITSWSTVAAASASTYLPTLTNVTNVTASTPKNSQYMRVGNIVTVFGTLLVTTNGLTPCEVDISLPVASSFGASTDANGLANSTSVLGASFYVDGDVVNDRARLKFTDLSGGGSGQLFYSFSYTVI